jgi:hypothetical protein
MYPQPELSRLAAHKAALRRDIFLHRAECVRAATRITQPLVLVDRLLAIWRQFQPVATLAALPLGLFVTRTFFPQRKLIGSLVRWAPLVFAAVRGIGSALKTHPGQARSPRSRG